MRQNNLYMSNITILGIWQFEWNWK